MKHLALIIPVIISAGCALGLGKSLHQYSLLDPPENLAGKKHHPVEVYLDDEVVLARGDTAFVDMAYDRFLASCPKGRIVNVRVKYATDLGFYAYRDKLWFNGECVE